jgi:hypothetical protein
VLEFDADADYQSIGVQGVGYGNRSSSFSTSSFNRRNPLFLSEEEQIRMAIALSLKKSN